MKCWLFTTVLVKSVLFLETFYQTITNFSQIWFSSITYMCIMLTLKVLNF